MGAGTIKAPAIGEAVDESFFSAPAIGEAVDDSFFNDAPQIGQSVDDSFFATPQPTPMSGDEQAAFRQRAGEMSVFEPGGLGMKIQAKSIDPEAYPVTRVLAGGVSQAGGSLARLAAQPFVDSETVQAGQQFEQRVNTAAEGLNTEQLSPGAAYAAGIGTGAVRSLTQATVGAPLGPLGIIGLFASTEANDAYGEARNSGKSHAEALKYAARAGTIEATPALVMQAFGLPGMEAVLPNLIKGGAAQAMGQGLKGALKQLGVSTIQELPEEIVTELGHRWNQAFSGMAPEATWADWAKIAQDTTLQTVATMGMAQSPNVTAGAVGDVRTGMENRRALRDVGRPAPEAPQPLQPSVAPEQVIGEQPLSVPPESPEGLGSLSARYESSGDPATVSTGVGDPGGVSYGLYQFASKKRTPQRFVSWGQKQGAPWAAELKGLKPGSPEFSGKWREISERNPEEFAAAQHAFTKEKYYDVAVNMLRERGIDIAGMPKAVHDAVWSMAVQHGPGATKDGRGATALVEQAYRNLAKSPDDPIAPSSLISEMYRLRRERYTMASIQARFKAEERDALAALSGEPTGRQNVPRGTQPQREEVIPDERQVQGQREGRQGEVAPPPAPVAAEVMQAAPVESPDVRVRARAERDKNQQPYMKRAEGMTEEQIDAEIERVEDSIESRFGQDALKAESLYIPEQGPISGFTVPESVVPEADRRWLDALLNARQGIYKGQITEAVDWIADRSGMDRDVAKKALKNIGVTPDNFMVRVMETLSGDFGEMSSRLKGLYETFSDGTFLEVGLGGTADNPTISLRAFDEATQTVPVEYGALQKAETIMNLIEETQGRPPLRLIPPRPQSESTVAPTQALPAPADPLTGSRPLTPSTAETPMQRVSQDIGTAAEMLGQPTRNTGELPQPAKNMGELTPAAVNAAAAETKSFGDMAFISDLHQRVAPDMPIAEFKQQLLEMHGRREIELNRADLVEAMDPAKVAASEARYLNSQFHFVRAPQQPARQPASEATQAPSPRAEATQPPRTRDAILTDIDKLDARIQKAKTDKAKDRLTKQQEKLWGEIDKMEGGAGSLASMPATQPGPPPAPPAQKPPKNTGGLSSVEMPEMVQFARDLMGGKYPRVRKQLRAGKGMAIGSFTPSKGGGRIDLKADLFADLDETARTLAHEIGHAVDFAPDETMKRGNIIGRMATLKKFMQPTFTGPNGVIANKGLRKELADLSAWWRPWNQQTATKAEKRYRNKGTELYADFFSVLMNDPDSLQQRAPKTWEAFHSMFDRKPGAKAVYDEIQSRIQSGDVDAVRLKEYREQFRRGEKRLADAAEARESKKRRSLSEMATQLKRHLWSEAVVLPEGARESAKQLEYMPSTVVQMLRELDSDVLYPLKQAGVSEEDLGVYMGLRRAATERQDMANPQGIQGRFATSGMAAFEQEIGPDAFKAIEQSAQAFWALRNKYIIPRIEQSDMWSDDLMDLVKNNENYATYSVQAFVNDFFGGNATGYVFQQKGTLNEILNPFIETVKKDVSLLRAAYLNDAKRDAVTLSGATSAKTKWNGRFKEPVEPDDPDLRLMTMRDKGETKGYYVHRDMAEFFDKDPHRFQLTMRTLGVLNQPLRRLFVTNNPFFAIWNGQRDFWANYKNLPGNPLTQGASLQYSYARTAKAAFMDAFLDKSTPFAEEMYRADVLIAGRSWAAKETTTEDDLQRTMERFGVKQTEERRILRTMAKWVFNDINQFMERWSKFAGADYLLRKGGSLDDAKTRQRIRNRAGSPDFLERGLETPLLNQAFMFSNANVQGTRASWHAMRENPVAYGIKTGLASLTPKLIMAAATSGLLDAWFGNDDEPIKDVMEGIPEEDRRNYITIPIRKTSDDKTVYMIMPQDFTGQVLGRVLTVLLEDGLKDAPALGSSLTGMAPYGISQMSPPIELVMDALQLMAGQNPYDFFRGDNKIADTTFDAGGQDMWKELGQAEWNAIFGSSLGKVLTQPVGDSAGERLGSVPLIGPALRRFIRVSDKGKTDALEDITRAASQEQAKISKRVGQYVEGAIERYAEGDLPSDSVLRRHARFAYREAKRQGDVFDKEYSLSAFSARYVSAATYAYGNAERKAKRRAGRMEREALKAAE